MHGETIARDAAAMQESCDGFDAAAFLRDFSADVAREQADVVPLPADEAQRAAAMSLAEFHAEYFQAYRARRLAAGTIAERTVKGERRCVRRYDEWDRAERPDEWPDGTPWRGMPLRYLNAGWLKRFLLALSRGGWRVSSIVSAWRSLSIVLNHARYLGVIRHAPRMQRLRRLLPAEEDRLPAIYSDDALARMYRAIDGEVAAAVASRLITWKDRSTLGERAATIAREMKAALVIGANCGPRASDLFRLRFDHFRLDDTPPVLRIRAGKTGKLHVVPLAEPALVHLAALPTAGEGGFLFREIVKPGRIDAKWTRRRCIALLRGCVAAAGLPAGDYPKPWQALRRSCTTRFNAHGISLGLGSVGRLITHGRDADVASRFYDNPLPTLTRAVETIGWPAEFLQPVFKPAGWFIPASLRAPRPVSEGDPRRESDWQFATRQAVYRGKLLQFKRCSRYLRLLQLLATARRPLSNTALSELVDHESRAKSFKTELCNLRKRLKRELRLPTDWNPIPRVDGGYVLQLP